MSASAEEYVLCEFLPGHASKWRRHRRYALVPVLLTCRAVSKTALKPFTRMIAELIAEGAALYAQCELTLATMSMPDGLRIGAADVRIIRVTRSVSDSKYGYLAYATNLLYGVSREIPTDGFPIEGLRWCGERAPQ